MTPILASAIFALVAMGITLPTIYSGPPTDAMLTAATCRAEWALPECAGRDGIIITTAVMSTVLMATHYLMHEDVHYEHPEMSEHDARVAACARVYVDDCEGWLK